MYALINQNNTMVMIDENYDFLAAVARLSSPDLFEAYDNIVIVRNYLQTEHLIEAKENYIASGMDLLTQHLSGGPEYGNEFGFDDFKSLTGIDPCKIGDLEIIEFSSSIKSHWEKEPEFDQIHVCPFCEEIAITKKEDYCLVCTEQLALEEKKEEENRKVKLKDKQSELVVLENKIKELQRDIELMS